MTPPKHGEDRPDAGQDANDEMAKYGITRIPVDYFHYKAFRYTNLRDAIAQARRDAPAVSSEGRSRP